MTTPTEAPDTIDIKQRMTAALAALQEWEREHFAEVSLDVAPECPQDWSRDYAIILFSLEGTGAEFFDHEAALEDAEAVFTETFGPAFTVVHGSGGQSWKPTPGKLYLQFHGREIEAYRYTPITA